MSLSNDKRPDCGKNWYVKGYESGACCGNEECDCMVVLDRWSGKHY